ncbi:glycosyltransferase family 2 protein, partial [Flavobacterium sp. YO12]|uniref:glycosyltransferase family 2 protein n=1 Tax=Flavobacterium sp. YO12 TaxID=1920029 RepID=UPI00100BF59A
MIITENSKVFLSICIPTFNRADKTANLIKSILLYKGTDIEVIVVDNCSIDDTQNTLKNIQDERFVYIQNETNIGSMPNVLKSLSLGKGKFVMLCLDKDFILYENLPLFIQKLKSFDNVSVGHCSLNYEKFENDTTSDKGLDSLLNIAYTSEHPSGIFLNNRILQKESIISKVYGSDKTFAFNTEILKSEMCVFGNAKRVNIPLVFTEKLEDCEK